MALNTRVPHISFTQAKSLNSECEIRFGCQSNMIRVCPVGNNYFYALGPLDELITKGLNSLRECLPGDAELTNQVMAIV